MPFPSLSFLPQTQRSLSKALTHKDCFPLSLSLSLSDFDCVARSCYTQSQTFFLPFCLIFGFCLHRFSSFHVSVNFASSILFYSIRSCFLSFFPSLFFHFPSLFFYGGRSDPIPVKALLKDASAPASCGGLTSCSQSQSLSFSPLPKKETKKAAVIFTGDAEERKWEAIRVCVCVLWLSGHLPR